MEKLMVQVYLKDFSNNAIQLHLPKKTSIIAFEKFIRHITHHKFGLRKENQIFYTFGKQLCEFYSKNILSNILNETDVMVVHVVNQEKTQNQYIQIYLNFLIDRKGKRMVKMKFSKHDKVKMVIKTAKNQFNYPNIFLVSHGTVLNQEKTLQEQNIHTGYHVYCFFLKKEAIQYQYSRQQLKSNQVFSNLNCINRNSEKQVAKQNTNGTQESQIFSQQSSLRQKRIELQSFIDASLYSHKEFFKYQDSVVNSDIISNKNVKQIMHQIERDLCQHFQPFQSDSIIQSSIFNKTFLKNDESHSHFNQFGVEPIITQIFQKNQEKSTKQPVKNKQKEQLLESSFSDIEKKSFLVPNNSDESLPLPHIKFTNSQFSHSECQNSYVDASQIVQKKSQSGVQKSEHQKVMKIIRHREADNYFQQNSVDLPQKNYNLDQFSTSVIKGIIGVGLQNAKESFANDILSSVLKKFVNKSNFSQADQNEDQKLQIQSINANQEGKINYAININKITSKRKTSLQVESPTKKNSPMKRNNRRTQKKEVIKVQPKCIDEHQNLEHLSKQNNNVNSNLSNFLSVFL